jgi:ZIP family zinc transporter
MEQVIAYFESINPILAAFYATLFPWGVTGAGAAVVLFVETMTRAVGVGMRGC